jgi:hypothetical protein
MTTVLARTELYLRDDGILVDLFTGTLSRAKYSIANRIGASRPMLKSG